MNAERWNEGCYHISIRRASLPQGAVLAFELPTAMNSRGISPKYLYSWGIIKAALPNQERGLVFSAPGHLFDVIVSALLPGIKNVTGRAHVACLIEADFAEDRVECVRTEGCDRLL